MKVLNFGIKSNGEYQSNGGDVSHSDAHQDLPNSYPPTPYLSAPCGAHFDSHQSQVSGG